MEGVLSHLPDPADCLFGEGGEVIKLHRSIPDSGVDPRNIITPPSDIIIVFKTHVVW